jgi:hypothetical protein
MFGRAKKVRFKVPYRFRSMEGKTNKEGIRRTGEQLVWGKLKLNALIDSNNPVMMHGINSEVKYVRILWKEINESVDGMLNSSIKVSLIKKPQILSVLELLE